MVQLGKKAAEGYDIYTHDGHMTSFVHTNLQGRHARHATGLCMHAGCTVARNTTLHYVNYSKLAAGGWNLNSSLGHAQNLYMQNNIYTLILHPQVTLQSHPLICQRCR